MSFDGSQRAFRLNVAMAAAEAEFQMPPGLNGGFWNCFAIIHCRILHFEYKLWPTFSPAGWCQKQYFAMTACECGLVVDARRSWCCWNLRMNQGASDFGQVQERESLIVENAGIDPATPHMQSECSTIWANSPSGWKPADPNVDHNPIYLASVSNVRDWCLQIPPPTSAGSQRLIDDLNLLDCLFEKYGLTPWSLSCTFFTCASFSFSYFSALHQ